MRIINSIYLKRRPVSILLIGLILILSLHVPVHANPTEIQVRNFDWRLEGDIVVIVYDLLGSADREYNVEIILRREQFDAYRLQPRTVRGHIGRGAFAGLNRSVQWRYLADVPGGLDGDDYYFEIIVSPVTKRGGGGWILVTLGLAAAGGAAYFFLGQENGNGPNGNGTLEPLPTPPSRP